MSVIFIITKKTQKWNKGKTRIFAQIQFLTNSVFFCATRIMQNEYSIDTLSFHQIFI
jgi:hypothetical protein